MPRVRQPAVRLKEAENKVKELTDRIELTRLKDELAKRFSRSKAKNARRR